MTSRAALSGRPVHAYPIVEGPDAFFDLLGSSSCHGLVYLTATSPSCTIVVNFEPDRPGRIPAQA